jgi:hypothetical protein
MIELAGFTEMPPEEIRAAMCEWLRFHGIDPNLVPIPCDITSDHESCSIWVDEFVLDKDGARTIAEDGTYAKVRMQHQGETAPLPMPCPKIVGP